MAFLSSSSGAGVGGGSNSGGGHERKARRKRSHSSSKPRPVAAENMQASVSNVTVQMPPAPAYPDSPPRYGYSYEGPRLDAIYERRPSESAGYGRRPSQGVERRPSQGRERRPSQGIERRPSNGERRPSQGYSQQVQAQGYTTPPQQHQTLAYSSPPQQNHAQVYSSPPQQHHTQAYTSPPQQTQEYSSSPPQPQSSYSTGQHPVYGAISQQSQGYGQSYEASHNSGQPLAAQSTIAFASSPPREPNLVHSIKSTWNKYDRIATKSYGDLRGQVTSSANKSVTMLTTTCIEKPTNIISKKSTQALNQGAALCDLISSKLDAVITSIDGERFSGKEQDLLVYENSPGPSTDTLHPDLAKSHGTNPLYPLSGGPQNNRGSNHFTKVWMYANSRLPPYLPPFKVYMPTYPLLCLAASYSERVYTPPAPKSSETEEHIPSDWRSGTKAMVLKTVPIDDMNTVVFAIRGSQTFMDWAVNYRSEPTSPAGFLDDEGNLCHAGFLYVARKMIKPVADRLRNLLQENPSRSHCSLLITGHSAGGAVAALLFAHMMSTVVESELNYLTGFFKRVHCVTFGAPPVSLLPLQKPDNKRHRKSLFYSFINEGDPVPRADKSVVRSLLKLYASPAPASCLSATLASMSKLNLSCPSNSTLPQQQQQQQQQSPPKPAKSRFSRPSKTSLNTMNTASSASTAQSWPVPPGNLSPAGRLVVLRPRVGGKGEEDVEAITVDDETLRSVVYGDPVKHTMSLYKRRVDGIAVKAVTAGGY